MREVKIEFLEKFMSSEKLHIYVYQLGAAEKLSILLPGLNPPNLVAHKARVNWSRIRIVLRMELLSSEWNYCPQPARIVPDY